VTSNLTSLKEEDRLEKKKYNCGNSSGLIVAIFWRSVG
jgi:hypothetical protein